MILWQPLVTRIGNSSRSNYLLLYCGRLLVFRCLSMEQNLIDWFGELQQREFFMWPWHIWWWMDKNLHQQLTVSGYVFGSSKCTKRVRFFLWRTILNWHPTNEQRCVWGFTFNKCCERSGAALENMEHILRSCHVVRDIWEQLILVGQQQGFFEGISSVGWARTWKIHVYMSLLLTGLTPFRSLVGGFGSEGVTMFLIDITWRIQTRSTSS